VAHQRATRRSAFLAGFAAGVRHAYRRFYRPVRYRHHRRRWWMWQNSLRCS